MFGLGKAEKKFRAITDISQTLAPQLEILSQVEKATVLVLANCFLDLAAFLYGRTMIQDPCSVDLKQVLQAIDGMLPTFDQLSVLAEDPATPRRKHVQCYRLAMGLAISSLAIAQNPELIKTVKKNWSIVWLARAEISLAVEWIRRYEQASGVEAVPRRQDGNPPNNSELIGIGSKVPDFLRKKKV